MFSSRLLCLVAACVLTCLQAGWADTRTIVMGGQTGLAWNGGGGQVEAVFQTGPRTVDTGNTPGGVVEFDILTPEEWRARFRLDIHWDEDDSTIPGGSIEGCFHALLVPKGDIREMVAPSKGGR